MTKQDISILESQDKIAKNGVTKYSRFKTNLGWVTAFDEAVITELRKHIGKIVSVNLDIDEQRGYKTIHDFIGVSESQAPIPEETFKPNGDNAGCSYYTSYAKDIFISLLNHDQMIKLTSQSKTEETEGTLSLKMHNAIELVKQAKGAFQ